MPTFLILSQTEYTKHKNSYKDRLHEHYRNNSETYVHGNENNDERRDLFQTLLARVSMKTENFRIADNS